MLAKWDAPEVAKVVHIFADNDANAAGAAGAWQLCHRLRLRGIEAIVHLPARVGDDYNDELLAQRSAA
jgi:hypothetical protein